MTGQMAATKNQSW